MPNVGVVVVGRNEGARLRCCLASLAGTATPVVYVDSASTDGSAALARCAGVEVVELDAGTPFSAARARNAGLERLVHIASGVQFVQFVDGDCEMVRGWIEDATRVLETRPDVAVVSGRRRERLPHASIYNRLADREWDTPIGEVKSCGGDAMMRVAALCAVGGFDASVAAGEEPELCQRLRDRGHKVVRIDAEMTRHDAAMLHFAQWWRRAVRSGYGAMDVTTRFGHVGRFVEQVRSARRWAIGWPLLMTVSVAAASCTVHSIGGALAVIGPVLVLLPVQMLRIARQHRKRGADWRTALTCGILTMIGKWANLAGHWWYVCDRASGRTARLLEYKS